MGFLLIGDVHSQGTFLSHALKHAKRQNLRPVLLGDIFDSRTANSETAYVWNQVRIAEQEQNAVILRSNHQERLLALLQDQDRETNESEVETLRTIHEFEEAGIDLDDVTVWLNTRPDGFVFRDRTGMQHCCAHAYFPSRYRNAEHDGAYYVYAESDYDRQLMSWGPYTRNHRRIRWWEESYTPRWIRCAGHYHVVHVDEKCLVLDANSGFEGGVLPTWNSETKELIHFGAEGPTIDKTQHGS